MMKTVSIIVLALVVLLLIYFVVYLICVRYMFFSFLKRKECFKKVYKKRSFFNKEIADWFDKTQKSQLAIISEDGIKLNGYLIDRNKSKTVIVFHGYKFDIKEMAVFAKMFVDFDCNVLVVHQRAHCKSGGNMTTFGAEEGQDVQCWIRYIKDKFPQQKIVLFGIDMGATSILFSLRDKECQNIALAICDSGYKSVLDHLLCIFKKRFKYFSKRILKVFSVYIKRAYDFDINFEDVEKRIGNYKSPLLLIHGEKDEDASLKNTQKIFNLVSSSQKELFVVKDAKHNESFVKDNYQYKQKIFNWLKKC